MLYPRTPIMRCAQAEVICMHAIEVRPLMASLSCEGLVRYAFPCNHLVLDAACCGANPLHPYAPVCPYALHVVQHMQYGPYALE